MTPLYHRVQTVLESYESRSETLITSDSDLYQTAQQLQTFLLITSIDLGTTLRELQTMDSVAPLIRERGSHVRPLIQRQQDLAARAAGYWQALDEVCTTFLEHSATDVVAAIFPPLNTQMAYFRTRWPQAQPSPAFYPEQRDITVALWHHLAPLPPTTAAEQH